MKEEVFKYLYSFKFNNKDYIYLVSKNYPFYFLEYDKTLDGFKYPDYESFQALYKMFYNNDTHLTFAKIDSLENLKEILHNLSFKLTPSVRTTSGLLSLALALTMCGCTQTEKSNDLTDNNSETSIVEVNDKSREIYEYFKAYDMEAVDREYDGNDYIFVRDFINSNNKHQITIESFDEFRKLNNIDFTPTWDDVITAFKNNENIDDEKKEIIFEGINNLRNCAELEGIDLSVLYVNAKRMKFKYLSTEEMQNTVNRDSVYAYFNPTTGTVYLPNDKPLEKFEFIHEVLGHGTLSYRNETEDELVVFDCTNHIMLPTDERYIGYSMGIMVSEGGANMLAHLATNDYSVSTFYELYEEELRVIAELCNVSIGELFNHKGISLYDLMYKNKINTPVEYIFKMDGIYKGQLYCEFSYLMERLFVDATEEKFTATDKSTQDKIIRETVNIIRNSYFKDRNELNFDYTDGTINYNFEETAKRYEDNMNGLRK